MCRRDRGTRGPAFGRPCPPEFVERVQAGAVSQRESWTRAVKASREVVCPIPRHAVILAGVIFTRRRARIGAAPPRLSLAQHRERARSPAKLG